MSKIGRLMIPCLILTVLTTTVWTSSVNETSSDHEESTSKLVFESNNESVRAKPYRVKINRKRCRYSEQEIDEMNNQNFKRLSNAGGYYSTRDSGDESRGVNNKHQPKARDHFNTRYGDSNHQAGYSIDQHHPVRHPHHYPHPQPQQSALEKEIVFANIGEKINLTCQIRAREIDWHFKDKNLTTTIISYGLQLQVSQPIVSASYDLADYASSFLADNDEIRPSLFMPSQRQERVAKYELSSDRHSTHVLTLHVQGAQDEGSYQCVDSKSEVPVKKTIVVYLKNNSRALTSGYSGDKFASIMLFYTLTSLIAIFNLI